MILKGSIVLRFIFWQVCTKMARTIARSLWEVGAGGGGFLLIKKKCRDDAYIALLEPWRHSHRGCAFVTRSRTRQSWSVPFSRADEVKSVHTILVNPNDWPSAADVRLRRPALPLCCSSGPESIISSASQDRSLYEQPPGHPTTEPSAQVSALHSINFLRIRPHSCHHSKSQNFFRSEHTEFFKKQSSQRHLLKLIKKF